MEFIKIIWLRKNGNMTWCLYWNAYSNRQWKCHAVSMRLRAQFSCRSVKPNIILRVSPSPGQCLNLSPNPFPPRKKRLACSICISATGVYSMHTRQTQKYSAERLRLQWMHVPQGSAFSPAFTGFYFCGIEYAGRGSGGDQTGDGSLYWYDNLQIEVSLTKYVWVWSYKFPACIAYETLDYAEMIFTCWVCLSHRLKVGTKATIGTDYGLKWKVSVAYSKPAKTPTT